MTQDDAPIAAAPAVVQNDHLLTAKMGAVYRQPIAVTGGTGTVTCVEAGGSLVGSGLTVQSDCSLAGTAATIGDYAFAVVPTDAAGVSGSARTLNVSVAQVAPFAQAAKGVTKPHGSRCNDGSGGYGCGMPGGFIVPSAGTTIGLIYKDPQSGIGSNGAVGTASNGNAMPGGQGWVANKYSQGPGPYVKVYDGDGNIQYDSKTNVIGPFVPVASHVGSPMIGEDGSVLVCDWSYCTRFDPAGNVIWQTPVPYMQGVYGVQSVVPVDNGMAVVDTSDGPVSAFDTATGKFLGSPVCLGGTMSNGQCDGTSWYGGTNDQCSPPGAATPGAGNTTYASTWNEGNNADGRFWRLDVNQEGVTPRYHEDFVGIGGASPMCRMVSDTLYLWHDTNSSGLSTTALPYVEELIDTGTAFDVVWQQPVAYPTPSGACSTLPGCQQTSNMPYDPQGDCVVNHTSGTHYVFCFSRTDGHNVWTVDTQIPTSHYQTSPLSDISFSNTEADGSGDTIMFLQAHVNQHNTSPDDPGHAFAAAFNTHLQTLLWSFDIGISCLEIGGQTPANCNQADGQFAQLVNAQNQWRLAFATTNGGMMLLGPVAASARR